MAKTTTCPITQSIQNAFQSIVNADGAVGTTLTTAPSNAKLLFTAGAEGSVIKSLTANSDDTSSRVLVIYISPDAGTTKYPIGSVSITTLAGQTGALSQIDILASSVFLGLPLDQSGRPVLPLAATYRVYVGVQVAVTAAKFLNVHAMGEDY